MLYEEFYKKVLASKGGFYRGPHWGKIGSKEEQKKKLKTKTRQPISCIAHRCSFLEEGAFLVNA